MNSVGKTGKGSMPSASLTPIFYGGVLGGQGDTMGKNNAVYVLILAGGVGSRFWPLSRQLEPKQFLCVTGERTLIQETLWRIAGKIKPDKIFLITNSAYSFDIQKQTADFSIPKRNIFLEPE